MFWSSWSICKSFAYTWYDRVIFVLPFSNHFPLCFVSSMLVSVCPSGPSNSLVVRLYLLHCRRSALRRKGVPLRVYGFTFFNPLSIRMCNAFQFELISPCMNDVLESDCCRCDYDVLGQRDGDGPCQHIRDIDIEWHTWDCFRHSTASIEHLSLTMLRWVATSRGPCP